MEVGAEERLRGVLRSPPVGEPLPINIAQVRHRATVLRRHRGRTVGAALTGLAVSGVVGLLLLSGGTHLPPQPSVLAPAPTAAATTAAAQATDLAVIRADGLHITVGASEQLLPSTQGATYPAWSPDGSSLAWLQGGSLWRLSVPGGGAARLGAATALAWSARGVLAGAGSALLLSGSETVRTVPVGVVEGPPVWDSSGSKLAVSTPAGIQVVPVLGDAARPRVGDGPGVLRSVERCSRPAAWLADTLLVWRATAMCSASLAADGLPVVTVDTAADRVSGDGLTMLTHPDWVRPGPSGHALVVGGGGRSALAGKAVDVAPPDGSSGPAPSPATSVTSIDTASDGTQVLVVVPTDPSFGGPGPGGRALVQGPGGGQREVGPPGVRAAVLAGPALLLLAGDTEHLHLWSVPLSAASAATDLGETAPVTDAYYGWFPTAQVAAARPAGAPTRAAAPSSPGASSPVSSAPSGTSLVPPNAPKAPAAPPGASDAATASSAPGALTTATGDLDGDHRLDRVVLDTRSGTLTALLADGRRLVTTRRSELPTDLTDPSLRIAGVSDLFSTGRGVVLIASSAAGCCGYRFDRGALTAYTLGDAALVPLLTASTGALHLSVDGGQGAVYQGFTCVGGAVVATEAHPEEGGRGTFLITSTRLSLRPDGRVDISLDRGVPVSADRVTTAARTAVSCPGLSPDGFARPGG